MTSTHHSTYHGGDQATEAPLSATVKELKALTVKTLRQHLAARNLPPSGTKAIFAHRLYNAIHGESLPAMLTETQRHHQSRLLLQVILLLSPPRQLI